MRASWLVASIALGLLSCGGGGETVHVEISGKTPGEGSALAARAVCTREARCGHVGISCSSGGAAGGGGSDAGGVTTSCAATISPVAYQGCYDDASSDIAKLLTCGALSAEQVNTLELCFDALAGQTCVTQAEADAQARAAERGEALPTETERPPSCDLLVHPPASCSGGPPTR